MFPFLIGKVLTEEELNAAKAYLTVFPFLIGKVLTGLDSFTSKDLLFRSFHSL